MAQYFEITSDQIGQLESYEAVKLFRDLIIAEAHVVGIEQNRVNIPSSTKAVTTKDGGVDGEVRDAHLVNEGHGLIKEGLTAYQVKAGANDEVNTISKAEKVITCNGKLNSRVQSCIEAGGTLAIALFGSDTPDTVEGHSKECVQKAIEKHLPNHPDYPNIEIWRQSDLAGFLCDFPSLRYGVGGHRPSDLHNVQTWAQLENMSKPVILGASQQQAIEAIRSTVTGGYSAPLRILGDAGVGKTRIALEALSVDGIKQLVIYAEKPTALPPGFLRNLAFQNNTERCILVVDECDRSDHAWLWDQISAISNRVQLITIFNASESASHNESQTIVYPLQTEEITRILESYDLPGYRAIELSAYCGGYPRVAHLLGDQIMRTGDFDIATTDDVWERCIAGTDDPKSTQARKRLRILKWLALFKRFGYMGPYAEEGNQVVAKIERETHIPACEIREEIEYLRKRKLIQGDYTLYITPKLMHLWLWTKWWDEQGAGFSYERFKQIDGEAEFGAKLLEWFFEMLDYGKTSSVLPSVVGIFFGDDGPFTMPAFLNSGEASRLLGALADIAPRETLAYIEQRMGRLSQEDLLNLHQERRGFVDSLQRVAWESELFERATLLLLRLAVTENEHYANNATGVFAELFSNATDVLAPSKADPEMRLRVLRNIAASSSPDEQKVAIGAISKGLDWATAGLKVVHEGELLHGERRGWQPETLEEWWGAYQGAWDLGYRCLETFEDENKTRLAEQMQSRAVALLHQVDNIEVVQWVSRLAQDGYADRYKLLKSIIGILKHQLYLSDDIRKELENLQAELVGTGFDATMKRYVGVDAFEDEFDGESHNADRLKEIMQELAHEVVSDLKLLQDALPWLSSNEAKRAPMIGEAIGRLDDQQKLWHILLGAYKDSLSSGDDTNPGLCIGYLQAAFENNPSKWNDLVKDMATDPALAKAAPVLICHSGMNDEALKVIIELFDENAIDEKNLSPLRLGIAAGNVSPELVANLINRLIERDTSEAAMLAISCAYGYCRSGGSIPFELRGRLVTQHALFDGASPGQLTEEYYWEQMSLAALGENPAFIEELVTFVVTALEAGAHREQHYLRSVLCKATETNPASTWKIIAPYIVNRNLEVISCFIGLFGPNNEYPISKLPTSVIMNWINDDVSRATAVARFASSDLFDNQSNPLLAHELLIAFGDNGEVADCLLRNASLKSWSGSAETALQKRIERFSTWKEMESNATVLAWIDRVIDSLEREKTHMHALEERGW